MDDQERRLLRELHDAFLKVPEGSPSGARPLLADIRVVVQAYQRASWVARALIWLLPAIAGVGVAVEKINTWLTR